MPDGAWPRKNAETFLRKLGRKHGVRIRWIKGRDWQRLAESYEAARMVFIPRPNNPAQFLVAMHEFGHMVGPLPASARETYIDMTPGEWHLAMEAAAWAWGIEHAPTWAMQYVMAPDLERTVGRGMWTHAFVVAERAYD